LASNTSTPAAPASGFSELESALSVVATTKKAVEDAEAVLAKAQNAHNSALEAARKHYDFFQKALSFLHPPASNFRP
jgi:hypothetical protein